MKRTSPTTCYFIGQIGFFLFNIILGCLYWIPDGNTFLGVSIASVLVGGFTNMLYLVSAYSIITNQYPKSEGVVIAFLDFIWAIGNTVGSAVGGTLIDLWAYPLPFFVLGTLIIFSIPWIVKYRATFNQDPGIVFCRKISNKNNMNNER
ncbi:MFS-type transporter SLC18B1-like [Ixodes scapularis]|uniref:MFS-type transporter SLC18B1-like n=1 Tax=Ixodes scapularis TaxID=6945 RepID=UPI001C38DED1|nr:MFS-type transporter SLC18B1-like [Ixodes scapularis]